MKRSLALAVMAAGLLAGCAGASTMRSEVTRFNRLPPPGGTVAVVAADARRSGDIEFGAYARQTAERLDAAGFRPATGDAPDYIAQLDYDQQPVAGGFDRGGGPRMSLGIGGASFGGHSAVGVGVGTSFDLNGRSRDAAALRTVTLVIERRADGGRVFEGRAQSMGPAANFTGAVSYMIDAIFTDFPGENGRTITVEAKVDRR